MRSFIFINRKSSSNKARIAISNLVKASNNKLHTLKSKENDFFFSVHDDYSEKLNIKNTNDYLIVCESSIYNISWFAEKYSLDKNIKIDDLIIYLYKNKLLNDIKNLIGNYFIFIFDKALKKIIAFSDHYASKDVYFLNSNDVFILSSNIRNILNCRIDSAELNNDRLLEYMIFSMQLHDETFFKNIFKLNGCQKLTLINNNLKTTKYLKIKKPKTLYLNSDIEYAERFREVFKEVITDYTNVPDKVSIALSGGLDSSSIISCAQKFSRNKSFIASSFIFKGLSDEDFALTDEKRYMDSVLKKYPALIKNEIFINDDGPINYLNKYIDKYEEPISSVNAYLLNNICISAKNLGANVHIEGFDGDSVISHGYEKLYQLGNKGRFIQLMKEMKQLNRNRGKNEELSYIKLIKRYAFRSYIPNKVLKYIKKHRSSLVDQRKLRLNAEVIDQKWLNSKQKIINKYTGVNKNIPEFQHFQTITHPIWQNAISSMNKIADQNNIEIKNPFFDIRLIKFCLSLPLDQKLKNGKNRYVFRNALKDIAPDLIINRYTKSDVSPKAKNQINALNGMVLYEEILSSKHLKDILNKEYLHKICSSLDKKDGENINWLTAYHTYALSKWLEKYFV